MTETHTPKAVVAGPEWDVARILDANLNRAREALRVLEDYARFVLNDGTVCRELKEIRHELAGAMERLPHQGLLAARDTMRDVGTVLSTVQERERTSVESVVIANCKRLQESMRSLEEYGKISAADVSCRMEQLRYRIYTLERLLVRPCPREALAHVKLYALLSGSTCRQPLQETIEEAAAGGVQMFQLREKELSDRELLQRARQMRRWTRATESLLIINDRPDLALLCAADGVHLGQDDMPIKEARSILGAQAIVGVSTHDKEHVHKAVRGGADYLALGPTFPSTTKEFTRFPGLEFVRQATAENTLPAFVIGGVTTANLGKVISAGGRRVAVGSAICSSAAPRATAQSMMKLLDAVR